MLKFFDDASIYTYPIAAALITILLVFLLSTLKDMDLPPGPTGLPFLGYYPFMRQDFHLQMHELAQKYGDVFSLRITGQLYIHIGSMKRLREVHVVKGDCFRGRMSRYNVLKSCFDKGVSFMEGDEGWRVLRKFYVQSLKDHGFSSIKDNLAGPVYDSLQASVEDIRNTEGAAFDAIALFTKHCTQAMPLLLFKGVDIAQEDVDALNTAYMDVIGGMMDKRLFLSGPIAKYVLLPLMPGNREMLAGKKKMNAILMRIIQEHYRTFDEHHLRDIVDCYILERNKRAQNNDPTAQYFTDEELTSTLTQLVGDGVLVVAHFIAMFLKCVIDHPEVQEKMHDELLEVVGSDRLPSWEDKSRLPYCNATILEILRTSDILAIAPSLECTTSTTLEGYRFPYKIPKGSVTLMNNWAIYHDPELYENPYLFDPTRFIAKDGKPKEETPMPFGVGKRACAGEPFVMMQVFLFMLTTVKNFQLSLPCGGQIPSEMLDIKLELCAQPRPKN